MPDLSPSHLMDRRLFLRRLGLTTGAVLGVSLLKYLDAAENPAKPLHVVIVGAGVAGLCAAYELEKRGHTVTILEADARHAGGRVRTLRFGDGLYGEAGAMRIPLRHELTRHYIKEFNLPLRRFVHSNPRGYYYVRGHRERIADVKNLNRYYNLSAKEKGMTPDDLWNEVVIKRLGLLNAKELADLNSVTLETMAVKGLDRLSLRDLCEQSGLSEEAIEMLGVTYGMETLLPTAATEHLREEREQVWAQEFHEIVGGTDRLPAAFVERLRSKPKMGCPVVRLEQDPLRRRAAAVYLEQGRERRVEGDFLLCTLPFPVLERLIVEPDFSGPKRRAIRELNYDSSTKVLAITRRRFWEEEDGIYGGGTFTDLPTGTTYYPANNAEAKDPKVSAGPGVMLASYTWGQAARRIATLPHQGRADLVIDHLSKVHPQLKEAGMVRRTASWSWDHHRWSGGAFAWFMPGQHSALFKDVVAPEGRIYFAGEHASLTHTWIQGALESALMAVRAMLAEGASRMRDE